jgi:hypothetical protein
MRCYQSENLAIRFLRQNGGCAQGSREDCDVVVYRCVIAAKCSLAGTALFLYLDGVKTFMHIKSPQR